MPSPLCVTTPTSLYLSVPSYPLLRTPPPSTCRFNAVHPYNADTQRLPLLSRPLPILDIGNDTKNNGTDIPPKTPTDYSSIVPTTHPASFSFPVFGPFDMLYCIQCGGFGATWAARDQCTGRLLCLKVFQSMNTLRIKKSVQTELRMFRRMVKSQRGRRGRQFIMELNRSIQYGTAVFFAMELMTIDLDSFLSLDSERCKLHARRWTAQIALGIESLHEMGIIHRDLKPGNILIDSRENVRIIDFGLSYIDPIGKPLRRGAEYANDFLGTVPYMAPEVLRNKGRPLHRRRRYGTAVDWWALGCIVFELESRNHQPLFITEDDVHAYIDWNQSLCGPEEKYSKLEGLDPIALNLLVEGLLHVHYSARYALSDLEKHNYFMLYNGSEFDDAGARALRRPIRPELVPEFAEDHRPVTVFEAAKLSSAYDWANLEWASRL